MSSLQELFVRSGGRDVAYDGELVSQLSRIPIGEGNVTVTFISPTDADQGVLIKAKGGAITLSDGSFAEAVVIWREPKLPSAITHHVRCPKGELLVWNTYRVHHLTGETTEDYWTGNAGMVLLDRDAGHRRYGCSDWRSPFDPSRLVFEVDWSQEGKRTRRVRRQ